MGTHHTTRRHKHKQGKPQTNTNSPTADNAHLGFRARNGLVLVAAFCPFKQNCGTMSIFRMVLSLLRMQLLLNTGRECEIHGNQGQETKGTDGSRLTLPSPRSPPQTNLLEQLLLTQQTPALAVCRSGQVRSGQVRLCVLVCVCLCVCVCGVVRRFDLIWGGLVGGGWCIPPPSFV